MEIWIVHSHLNEIHAVWAFKSYDDAWNYAIELKNKYIRDFNCRNIHMNPDIDAIFMNNNEKQFISIFVENTILK